MWTIIVFAFCTLISASEFEILEDNNGWVPVSSDVVYQQMKRGFTQPTRYTKAHNVETMHTETGLHSIVTQEYKIEDTIPIQKTNRNDFERQDISSFNHKYNKNNTEYKNEFQLPFYSELKNNTTDVSARKSKKLHNFYDIIPELKETDSARDYSKSYEVKENINNEDEIQQEETVLANSGYTYNIPRTKDFAKDLIKHLSKYNINEHDNPQNYALSRRHKVVSPSNKAIYKPLHFKVPFRYNNLNHMPVDPMLAVFLSNYGYYLQGQYGIQNNYNNLYGYLASNNIHNNRPFGLYKVFSDTDSSQ